MNYVFNIIRNNKSLTSNEIKRHLFEVCHIDIADRTIREYRRMKFHAAHELLVTQFTQQHYIDRVAFCIEHEHNNFHRTVFSDEKTWYLSHTSSIVWIEDGEPIPVREITSTHTKVMVWGGVWYNGKTELGIIEGKVDRFKYINVLSKYLLPSMPMSPGFVFMQDGASPHKPDEVHKFLYDHGITLLRPWPAHSPDFNPIEHCWSWMTQFVNNERPTNRVTLINAINKAWDALKQKTIRSYFDNLPTQMQAVYNNGGARLD